MHIVYEGPSSLNDDPIVAILTNIDRPSENQKTGPNQSQLWIMRSDMNPLQAVKTGQDDAVCGTCPLRASVCYVNLAYAPNNIWKRYNVADKTVHFGMPDKRLTKRKSVRLGAYGDPAALPLTLIEELVPRFGQGHTGFTHLWRQADPELKRFCLASVETPELAAEAQALGWRTFRIRASAESKRLPGEALCAYEATKLQCDSCGACNGTKGPFTSNLVTTVHGLKHKQIKFINPQLPFNSPHS